jgi:hypothetical protein
MQRGKSSSPSEASRETPVQVVESTTWNGRGENRTRARFQNGLPGGRKPVALVVGERPVARADLK